LKKIPIWIISSSVSARKLPSRNIFENGVRVFLAMYNAPKSEHNIDNFPYTQFIKSTRLNKPMQLSSLPPTSAAAQSCLLPNPNLFMNNIISI
jgi:hypothetical protein